MGCTSPKDSGKEQQKTHWGAEEGLRGDSVQMLVSAAAFQPCCHTASPPGQTDGYVIWLINPTHSSIRPVPGAPWWQREPTKQAWFRLIIDLAFGMRSDGQKMCQSGHA